MEGAHLAAPIEPGALAPCLAPPGKARSLPAVAYTSREVFDWERRHFFEGSWVCVGRGAALASVGAQAAVRIGEEGVLLARGSDGVLRGFFNVCRHRGHELLPAGATAERRAIRCPYHAWVYGLDGALRATPRFPALSATDPVREGLAPTSVREWLGWIFVNASGDGPDFDRHVGTLGELLAPYLSDPLVPCETRSYEVAANWKLIVENYHECYHCPSIHPELCRVTPFDSGENLEPTGLWAGGSMDLKAHAETMSISGGSDGHPLPGLDEWRLRHVFYFGLFPSLLISPHPDYVLVHRVEPLDPGRSRIECQWLFHPEAAERPGFDPSYAVRFWDITNAQDWKACESVQRGASSRGYRQGPLGPDESAVHQFVQMVAGGYLDGSARRPSPPRP